MGDTAIRVEGLGKLYRIGAPRGAMEGQVGLREVLEGGVRRLSRRLRGRGGSSTPAEKDFWALKDVSFEVKRGECVGVIGRNGAGKSTLLKILSRITEPTTGEVGLRGRVGSLLEVGTGFHPELTGRENIYLNGSVLGMTRREIAAKFDEIVAFSEVEEFLDTPVKRYSSGMYVRLAFAVAAHLEPEILIVDEVLAVGDATFQKKCLGKMGEVATQGRTVLFVSHTMSTIINICSQTIHLSYGSIIDSGISRDVVDRYLLGGVSSLASQVDLTGTPRPSLINSSGASITALEWLTPHLQHGEAARVKITYRISRPLAAVAFGIGFSTLEGVRFFTTDSDMLGHAPDLTITGSYSIEMYLPELIIAPGIYNVDIGMRSGEAVGLDYIGGAAKVEILPGPRTPACVARSPGEGVRATGTWLWGEAVPGGPSLHPLQGVGS